jgi:hypothetical protein
VKNEPKAELESVNVRSPSVAESLRPVKTEAEKEKEKEAELMRCLKKYKALGDKIRLLSGQPVEVSHFHAYAFPLVSLLTHVS